MQLCSKLLVNSSFYWYIVYNKKKKESCITTYNFILFQTMTKTVPGVCVLVLQPMPVSACL